MITTVLLGSMGTGAVRQAITTIESELRVLSIDIRRFDATPAKLRTDEDYANQLQVEAIHQRLTNALAELRALQQRLAAPIPFHED